MSGSDGIGWGEDPSGTRAAGWGPKESTTTAQNNSPMVNQWADGVGTEAWAASIGKPKVKILCTLYIHTYIIQCTTRK